MLCGDVTFYKYMTYGVEDFNFKAFFVFLFTAQNLYTK